MSERQLLARSFGAVAETYERARPLYAEDALTWIGGRLPLHGDVLDLGAGTGKLTRQLAARAASVVAVEPDDAMRAVLARVVPAATALAGSAEAIPLADGAVDVVAVGQAFHWFDLEPALAEMHRVLRPGGGIALLWNELQWRELDEIVRPLRPRVADEDASARLRATSLFQEFAERSFAHRDRVDADIVVERVSSISAVISAEPDVRADALARVRALVGDGAVDYPMRTLVVAARRA